MPFHPDIVVTEPGSSQSLLVVETVAVNPTADSDASLRRYMVDMACPVGLLVSPREIVVYRNLFTDYLDNSIRVDGVFPAPAEWSEFEGSSHEFEFERHVQSWLEGLTDRPIGLSLDATDSIQRLVVPGLLSGAIHAGHPRMSR